MNIEEFIIARVNERSEDYTHHFYIATHYSGVAHNHESHRLLAGVEFCNKAHERECVLAWAEMVLEIVEWHKNWPVLVESKPKLTMFDDFDIYNIKYSMSNQIAWTTQDLYIKTFGTQPPTAPIMAIIARQWKNHPDYNEDWNIDA